MVEIGQAGCLREIGAESGYLAHSINSVSPTGPTLFEGMTVSNWMIATLPQRFDAPRQKIDPCQGKSKTAGLIF
jgi:hypothetical protein